MWLHGNLGALGGKAQGGHPPLNPHEESWKLFPSFVAKAQ